MFPPLNPVSDIRRSATAVHEVTWRTPCYILLRPYRAGDEPENASPEEGSKGRRPAVQVRSTEQPAVGMVTISASWPAFTLSCVTDLGARANHPQSSQHRPCGDGCLSTVVQFPQCRNS